MGNKFANPPYLAEFDPLKATKLRRILLLLSKTCCSFQTCEGAIEDLDRLISRPSSIRKCDLYKMKDIVEAINKLE